MSPLALVLAAVLLGALLPLQAGANVRLSAHLPGPAHAAAVNFVVGAVVLLLAVAAWKPELPAPARVAQAPWWAWIGGVLGACFVLGAVLLTPRLGPAVFLAAMVAGQMLASLAIDHHGWLGFAVREVTPGRALGAALVLAGVILVRVF